MISTKKGNFLAQVPLPSSERAAYNYLNQARAVDQQIIGSMTKIWAIYHAISRRTAVLIGRFWGTVNYAMEIQNRANRIWRTRRKRRRGDRFKVFLSHENENLFRQGW